MAIRLVVGPKALERTIFLDMVFRDARRAIEKFR
jgi:hypothetical protein